MNGILPGVFGGVDCGDDGCGRHSAVVVAIARIVTCKRGGAHYVLSCGLNL